MIATDKTVPDRKKGYIVVAAGHSGEPCGREGSARFVEDLVAAAASGSDELFDNGGGTTGKTFQMTASEILKKAKVYFISPSPDGWAIGDGYGQTHSQYNGASINSNRLAYTDGWSFPRSPILYLKGYATYSQPEGIAMTKYLTQVREKELHGKPFTIGMDMHGPTPFGFILMHDEGLNPEKLERMVDLGTRVGQKMEETVPVFGPLDQGLDAATRGIRDSLPDSRDLGTDDNTFWRYQDTARWGFVTHIVDSFLGYTAAGSWGGFFSSESGLGATSLSYEINCRPSSPWAGADQQLYANNVRNVLEAGTVTTAAWSKIPIEKTKIPDEVGFYETGERVTDADGNPVPPPSHFPDNPLVEQIRQGHYDVSNTDFFRDLRPIVNEAPTEVRANELSGALKSLDRFVIADETIADTGALHSFVEGGGDLVLTDSALKMLPDLTKLGPKTVELGYAYVGYSELDRSQTLTKGLLDTAWQTYAPTPIGYPLLMERDGYWGNSGDSQSDAPSPTKNSAPIWTVDRDAWEAAGGITVGTADPPKDRKSTSDGTAQDKTEIGILDAGKGHIVIFGALLPKPTEAYDHWFGLNGYSISAAGQTMLLRVLAGKF